jgi:uncharacterized cupin superfamily protein
MQDMIFWRQFFSLQLKMGATDVHVFVNNSKQPLKGVPLGKNQEKRGIEYVK